MKEKDIKIGTKVLYYPVMENGKKQSRGIKTIITSEPWKLGHGEIVCKVRGITGGVSIKHLKKRKIRIYKEPEGNALTDAAGAVIDFITNI